ncbi:MAG: molybdenum cofactor biosynthesis protein MoaE, partial [Planctomycetota bacterium]
RIAITLTEGPLSPAAPSPVGAAPDAGAWVVFDGVVRPSEAGRVLAALVYEAYEPMTTRELRSLAEQVTAKHGLSRIAVTHSVGRVAVGEASFRLEVAAPHRAEALAATAEFIDRMKRGVPLWKTPVFA